MASRKAIAVVSALLAKGLGQPIPAESLDVWEVVLNGLHDEEAILATLRVLRETERCFPVAPGAIFQAARRLRIADRLPGDEAWMHVLDYLHGTAKSVVMPEDVKSTCARIGWSRIQNLAEDDTRTRGEFLKCYEEWITRDVDRIMDIGSDKAVLALARGGEA